MFSQRRGFFDPFLTVKFLKSVKNPSRFTVVVSTKVAKSAVKRNRLKRILREFIRLRLNHFALGDYAIIVRPKAMAIKEQDLLLNFERLLKTSGLLYV
ncbi:MAG: ribonuclease P protein component [Candidatus Doudnabacteria bacterium]|nr:ribonuclease P protein component [Candidatus Doudnabacteria bacterium]